MPDQSLPGLQGCALVSGGAAARGLSDVTELQAG